MILSPAVQFKAGMLIARNRQRGGIMAEDTADGGSNKRLKGRLKGIRKRKRSKTDFECGVMALKVRLVKAREESER